MRFSGFYAACATCIHGAKKSGEQAEYERDEAEDPQGDEDGPKHTPRYPRDGSLHPSELSDQWCSRADAASLSNNPPGYFAQ